MDLGDREFDFLAEVLRTRREDTHRDYRGKLRTAELGRFAGIQIAPCGQSDGRTAAHFVANSKKRPDSPV
jgi:hypothetical protein